MKRYFLFFLLLLTACGSPTSPTPEAVKVNAQAIRATSSPAGLGDPFYPRLGNRGYDVAHYEINLAVDPAANTISGTTSIEAMALEELAQFDLDLSGLNVDSVSVNNETAEFSRHQMELIITPHSPLAAQKAFRTVVSYHGSPAAVGDDGIHMLSGWQSMPGGTFVFSEPAGAMTWFPATIIGVIRPVSPSKSAFPAGTRW